MYQVNILYTVLMCIDKAVQRAYSGAGPTFRSTIIAVSGEGTRPSAII